MQTVIIAIGSNTRQRENIQWAAEQLGSLLEKARFSSTLWTPDIHGSGVMYLNQLATGLTGLTAEELTMRLKQLEAASGRSSGHVTLDLDLLQYGECRYHEKDWSRPYVQQLIADIL